MSGGGGSSNSNIHIDLAAASAAGEHSSQRDEEEERPSISASPSTPRALRPVQGRQQQEHRDALPARGESKLPQQDGIDVGASLGEATGLGSSELLPSTMLVGGASEAQLEGLDFEDVALEEEAQQEGKRAPQRSSESIRNDHISSDEYLGQRKGSESDDQEHIKDDVNQLPVIRRPSMSSSSHARSPARISIDLAQAHALAGQPGHEPASAPLPSSSAGDSSEDPSLSPTSARIQSLRNHVGIESPASTSSSLDSPAGVSVGSRPSSSASSAHHQYHTDFSTCSASSSRTTRRYSHHQSAPSRASTATPDRDRRHVEGRYRGRMSRPTSRAASPERGFSIDSVDSAARRRYSAFGYGSSRSAGISPSASAFDLSRSERQSLRQGHPPLAAINLSSTFSTPAKKAVGLGMMFTSSAPKSTPITARSSPGLYHDQTMEAGYHSDYALPSPQRRRQTFYSYEGSHAPSSWRSHDTVERSPSADRSFNSRGRLKLDMNTARTSTPPGALRASISTGDMRNRPAMGQHAHSAPLFAMNVLTLGAVGSAAPSGSKLANAAGEGFHEGIGSQHLEAAEDLSNGVAMTVVGEDGELHIVRTPTTFSMPPIDHTPKSSTESNTGAHARQIGERPRIPEKNPRRASRWLADAGPVVPAGVEGDRTADDADRSQRSGDTSQEADKTPAAVVPALAAEAAAVDDKVDQADDEALRTPVAPHPTEGTPFGGGPRADEAVAEDEIADLSLPESDVASNPKGVDHHDEDQDAQRRAQTSAEVERDATITAPPEAGPSMSEPRSSASDGQVIVIPSRNSTSSQGRRSTGSAAPSSARSEAGTSAPNSASLTRLSTLPPKSAAEENAHKALHQDMLLSFRALQAKREAELAARRQAKEEEWAELTPVWEKDILPSWTRARRDERLREVWWKGAPPNLRARVWGLVCGNALMLPRNLWAGVSKAVEAALAALEATPPPSAREGDNDEVGASAASKEQVHSTPEGVWRIPPAVLHEIEEDIEDALPSLKLFQRATGPMWEDLRALLCALVLLRLEKLGLAPPKAEAEVQSPKSASMTSPTSPYGHAKSGSLSLAMNGDAPVKVPTPDDIDPALLYQRGLAPLGAMLLCNLSPSEALIALLNLLAQRPWLRVLFGPSPGQGGLAPPTLPPASSLHHRDAQRANLIQTALHELETSRAQLARERDGMERVFDTLLADQMPKVFANMQARGVRPRMYLRNWLRSMFASWLPFDAVARLWDNILLEETDSMVYRTALALVQLLESRLYETDAEELTTVLNGRNRVILEVWHRQLSGPFGSARDCEAARLSVGRHWVGGVEQQQQQHRDAGGISSESGHENGREEDGGKLSTEGTAPPSSAGKGSEVNGSHIHQPAPSPQPTKPTHDNTPTTPHTPHTQRAIEAPASLIPLDNIFAQYDIGEDALFGALEAQRAWWKDSTLERLLDRELGM